VQLIELLIFAALAAVVLYQLYAVLGRRVGRQPEEGLIAQPARPADDPDAPLRDEGALAVTPANGMAALRARDSGFDPARFLQGARSAYEMIVSAFASGDRDTLKRLTAPNVLAGFEKALAARDAEGRSESVEFAQPPRADLEKRRGRRRSGADQGAFLAEFRSRSKGPEGEAVDGQAHREVWTFERRFSNRDPNWTLVRVDAAEA